MNGRLLVVHSHIMLVGMIATGTFCGWLGAVVHITAHKTLPVDRCVAFPYGTILNLLQIALETIVVEFFHSCDSKDS